MKNTSLEVAKLRAQIIDVKAQQEALRSLPRSHAETRKDLRQWCERVAEAPLRKLSHAVHMVGYGQGLSETAFSVRPMPGMPVDVSPVVIALLGPAVVAERLASLLDGTTDGPTAEQRAEREAALADKLFALELAEEQLIEQSEAENAPIVRRADADPRAVLWVDPSERGAAREEMEEPAVDEADPLFTSTPVEERRATPRTQPSRYLTTRRA